MQLVPTCCMVFRAMGSPEQVFEVGMLVTVEPGIYLPGKFGVRIEDDLLLTPDGNEVLSNVPREFEEAIVPFLA